MIDLDGTANKSGLGAARSWVSVWRRPGGGRLAASLYRYVGGTGAAAPVP
jgi:enolase